MTGGGACDRAQNRQPIPRLGAQPTARRDFLSLHASRVRCATSARGGTRNQLRWSSSQKASIRPSGVGSMPGSRTRSAFQPTSATQLPGRLKGSRDRRLRALQRRTLQSARSGVRRAKHANATDADPAAAPFWLSEIQTRPRDMFHNRFRGRSHPAVRAAPIARPATAATQSDSVGRHGRSAARGLASRELRAGNHR